MCHAIGYLGEVSPISNGISFSFFSVTLRQALIMPQPVAQGCHFVPFYSDIWRTSVSLPWNPFVYCIVAAILAVAYWLVLQLTFEVYLTFKRHDGLYFWSILVSTWGVAFRSIGWTIEAFVPDANRYLCTTFLLVGLSAMVTGFSFALYSRLHLIIRDRRILRTIFVVIIFNGVAFILPLMVAEYGLRSSDPGKYVSLTFPAERLYALGYFIQEFILGCLYIWTARTTVLHSFVGRKRKATATLIGAQVLVILLDIPTLMLAWPWAGMGAALQILGTLHPTTYAIKLKIELVVLNQLVEMVNRDFTVQMPGRDLSESGGTSNTPSGSKRWRSVSKIKLIISPRSQQAKEKRASTHEGFFGV